MTVSSATSACGVNATGIQSSSTQTRADFQALSSALQSGDLATAQQAFAQLQQDNPRLAQALNSPPSSSDSPRLADLKSLASALQAGDVNGAQQAFAKLQQDAQSVAGQHHHHHMHSSAGTADSSSTSGTDADGDNDGSTAAGSVLNASA